MTDKEFDEMLDEMARKPSFFSGISDDGVDRTSKRVNVEFPSWIVTALDTEARRLGVTRTSVIKTWLVDRLDQNADHKTGDWLRRTDHA